MSIARRPSKITLPQKNCDWSNLLEFLVFQFPLIKKSIWISRFQQGKIHWQSGEYVTAESAFIPGKVLCYYREVLQEPCIPFKHKIIFQDEHLLVADKPHFLPVTPGGQYINECLLERLRQQENLPDIVPLHRLDRETAGLVLFSVNPQSRGIYSQLFATDKISKTYWARAELTGILADDTTQIPLPKKWTVNNRLQKSNPQFLMQEVEGKINARSKINLLEIQQNLGLFQLNPITGKTHQLRLHMNKIGMPILNDKYYPALQAKTAADYTKPLQLLAKQLQFKDPLSGVEHQFESTFQLLAL